MQMDDLVKTASSLVSGAIVVGSVALKVPQIARIVRSGNANGVSLLGNVVEGLGFAISASWGFVRELPFGAYGEAVVILAQMAALILLIGYANGGSQLAAAAVAVAAIAAAGYALAMGAVPLAVHESLMAAQIGFVIFSRVPQIVMNHSNRATGALSFATYFLAFGGGAARAFTNLVSVPWEKGKLVMFTTALLSCALNAIIVLQIFVYGADGKAAAGAKVAAASAPAAKKKTESRKAQ